MIEKQYKRLDILNIPKYKDISRHIEDMPDRALVVEYFMTKSMIYLFSIYKGTKPQVFKLPANVVPNHETIEVNIRRSRGLGSYPRSKGFSGSELIQPLFPEAKNASIIYIIPHGYLDYCPLHAIPCTEGTLLDYAPVIYLPSLMFFSRKNRTDAKYGASLIMGNMTEDLPGAEQEANEVAEIVGTSALLRQEATLKAFEEHAPSVDLIHLAGHGYFDPDDPLTSGIPFSDGILTVSRIYEMRLNNTIVILSGCVTGLGDRRPGQGFASLMGAFFLSGAQAVLVSLWPVDDQITAKLMTTLYNAHYHQNIIWPVAIQNAMLSARALAEMRDSQHAYYLWAPFKPIGVWK